MTKKGKASVPETKALSAGYIIFAEDDLYYSSRVEDHVSKAGFEIDIARDGETTIFMAKRRVPDLFLIDLLLPVLDGFETIKRIRNEKDFEDSKIIALCNQGHVHEIKSAEEIIDDYIVKTLASFEEIVEKITTTLKV